MSNFWQQNDILFQKLHFIKDHTFWGSPIIKEIYFSTGINLPFLHLYGKEEKPTFWLEYERKIIQRMKDYEFGKMYN